MKRNNKIRRTGGCRRFWDGKEDFTVQTDDSLVVWTEICGRIIEILM